MFIGWILQIPLDPLCKMQTLLPVRDTCLYKVPQGSFQDRQNNFRGFPCGPSIWIMVSYLCHDLSLKV